MLEQMPLAPGFSEVAVEATTIVSDAELGAQGERRALIKHNAGEVEQCHRVLRLMLDEHLYLAR
jgi:hypothetical protein